MVMPLMNIKYLKYILYGTLLFVLVFFAHFLLLTEDFRGDAIMATAALDRGMLIIKSKFNNTFFVNYLRFAYI